MADPQGWAAPDVAEGTLYASIEKGKMAALDPDDLSVKWVFPSKDDEDQFDLEGIYGTPIVDEGFVYFGAYDGNVYALERGGRGATLGASRQAIPIINSLTLRGDYLVRWLHAMASCTPSIRPPARTPARCPRR